MLGNSKTEKKHFTIMTSAARDNVSLSSDFFPRRCKAKTEKNIAEGMEEESKISIPVELFSQEAKVCLC